MERNKFIDSAKFILVFFVVFAHTCEYDLYQDIAKQRLYIALSTFTIPLFIVISGFFSKNTTWEKYKKFFLQTTLIYFIFQLIYCIPSMFSGYFTLSKLLVPIGPLWYIAGLLLWRFLAYIINKFTIPFYLSFSLSLVLSLTLGFIDNLDIVIRVFTFIPFFILGLYSPSDIFVKIKKLNKIYFIIYFVILSLYVIYFTNAYHAFTVLGGYSYNNYESVLQGFLHRLFFIPIAIISLIAAFNLLPDTFHKLGTKSMAIFLLHIILVYPVYRPILQYYNVVMPVYIDFMVAALITTLCIFASSIKPVQYILRSKSVG